MFTMPRATLDQTLGPCSTSVGLPSWVQAFLALTVWGPAVPREQSWPPGHPALSAIWPSIRDLMEVPQGQTANFPPRATRLGGLTYITLKFLEIRGCRGWDICGNCKTKRTVACYI